MKSFFKINFFNFLSWCPGAPGFYLRQKFFPFYFGDCGRKVIFGRFLKVDNPQTVKIGARSVIGDRVTISTAGGSYGRDKLSIEIGYGAFIGVGTTIYCLGGAGISIGQGASLGSNCIIRSVDHVYIGSKALLAAYCQVGSDKRAVCATGQEAGPVLVGDECWLGARSSVCDGAVVGRGCVVGAHGVVVGRLPEYSVAVGSPASVIRYRSMSTRVKS